MDVVYVSANNPSGAADQGQLMYSITCQAPGGANCNYCEDFSTSLEGEAILSAAQPELATFFAGAQFVTDAICALEGCYLGFRVFSRGSQAVWQTVRISCAVRRVLRRWEKRDLFCARIGFGSEG